MNKITTKQRRKLRIGNTISGTTERPRLSVYRSSRNIVAQIIDDVEGKTIVGLSTASLKDAKGTKTVVSKELGLAIAKEAIKKNITKVVFDRGISRYHGRIQAVADGAREGGLEF